MKNSFLLPILLFFTTTVQAQWQQVTQLVSNNIYELYALDQQKLFLGVEYADIFVSQNGGMDYEAKDLEPYGYIAAVDFEDAMIGYAAGGCYFPTEECHGKTFYKTTDAGQTWSKLHGTPIIGVYQDLVALGNGMVYVIEDSQGCLYQKMAATNSHLLIWGPYLATPAS